MIGNKDADRSLLIPKWLSYRKSFPPEFEIPRTEDYAYHFEGRKSKL